MPKTFELQHWCQTTRATNGLGVSTEGLLADEGEVFSSIELWKVA